MSNRKAITIPPAGKPSLQGEVIDTRGASADEVLKLARRYAVDFLRLQFADILPHDDEGGRVAKRRERLEYATMVSRWEIDRYLALY